MREQECTELMTAGRRSRSLRIITEVAISRYSVRRYGRSDELLKTEVIDGELFVTSDHEMTKQHYISFVAYVCDSTVMMFRQYPEW